MNEAFRADTFEDIDGVNWLFHSDDPENRREVVEMLDSEGLSTYDPDFASGGVVEVGPGRFQVFWFGKSAAH